MQLIWSNLRYCLGKAWTDYGNHIRLQSGWTQDSKTRSRRTTYSTVSAKEIK